MYESPFLHHVLATTVVIRKRRQSATLTTIAFVLLLEEEPEMYIWLGAVLVYHAHKECSDCNGVSFYTNEEFNDIL